MEELEAEEKTQAESGGDEPVDLIELVRSKHDNVSIKTERLGDVLVMQLTLCVILLLVFAVINILESDITRWYAEKFREMSGGETEKIFERAVFTVLKYFND